MCFWAVSFLCFFFQHIFGIFLVKGGEFFPSYPTLFFFPVLFESLEVGHISSSTSKGDSTRIHSLSPSDWATTAIAAVYLDTEALMALNLLEQLPPQPRLSTAAIHAQAEAVGTAWLYTWTQKKCHRFHSLMLEELIHARFSTWYLARLGVSLYHP